MRPLHERIDDIEVRRYPQWPAARLSGYLREYVPSLLFSAWWLARVRARGPVDVIHGCNPPDLFWVLGLVGRMWGARYVFDQHDVNPELSRTKFGDRGLVGRILHWLTRWLEQRSYDSAALVLAPNDSYAQIARTRGRVANDRLVVVRNAPDVAKYRSLADGVARRAHAVGYVGVMGSQDGLDVLLAAWARVVRVPGLHDAHLELVGDGEARPALERLVDEFALGGQVTFHGYLPPNQFVPLLASCAVCVSPDPPTPFNDVSTMVKVVDYIAVGRGIVAFDLRETKRVAGAAVEVVADASAESLADSMVQVLTDPARLQELEHAAQQRIHELDLDWSVSARDLVTAYRMLIAPGSRGVRTKG